MRDIKVASGILVAAGAPLPTAAEYGRQDGRISGRSKQLNALQDRRLAAVIGAHEEVDTAKSIDRERTEPPVTRDLQ